VESLKELFFGGYNQGKNWRGVGLLLLLLNEYYLHAVEQKSCKSVLPLQLAM